MATLEDIAKRIGVSKSTVSKALSGAGDVSEHMRRTVLETAVELGYSRLHRSDELRQLAFFTDPSLPSGDILVAFRKLAEPGGYLVPELPLPEAPTRRYEEYMLQHNYLGGFFLGLPETHPWKDQLDCCRIPTALFAPFSPTSPYVTRVDFARPDTPDWAALGKGGYWALAGQLAGVRAKLLLLE